MAIRKKLASSETIEARFGQSRDEIARLTDTHTLAVQSWLSTRAPQVERFDSLGIIANSRCVSRFLSRITHHGITFSFVAGFGIIYIFTILKWRQKNDCSKNWRQ